MLKGKCSRQNRNLHYSRIELLKMEVPKGALIPALPESSVQFRNCAVHEVGILLIVGILYYAHCYAKHSITVAVV